MIRRIWMFLVAGVALVTALGAAWVAESQYETLIATTELVVPAVDIPPYTLVAPALLTTRSVPAPLANEPVYHTAADVAGKIARVPLAAGRLIYADQAVSPARFRYTDDERLEVLSFPVAPEQAVGGQIKAGMRINLYRVALPNGSLALPGNLNAVAPLTPTPRPTAPAVRVELLAGSVPVVDVRASGGAATGRAGKLCWAGDAGPGGEQRGQAADDHYRRGPARRGARNCAIDGRTARAIYSVGFLNPVERRQVTHDG